MNIWIGLAGWSGEWQDLTGWRLLTIFVLDVHTTNGTPAIGRQPLVHALNMEQMHARQTAYILGLGEVAQTNCALLTFIVIVLDVSLFDRLTFGRFGVLIRKSVGFYSLLTSTAIDT